MTMIVLNRLQELAPDDYNIFEYKTLVSMANTNDLIILRQAFERYLPIADLNEVEKKQKLYNNWGFEWNNIREFVAGWLARNRISLTNWGAARREDGRVISLDRVVALIRIDAADNGLQYNSSDLLYTLEEDYREYEETQPVTVLEKWLVDEGITSIKQKNNKQILAGMREYFSRHELNRVMGGYTTWRLTKEIEKGVKEGWLKNYIYGRQRVKSFDYVDLRIR